MMHGQENIKLCAVGAV